MTTITFDTLKYARRLQDAGFSQQQAEAFTTAQKEVFAETMDSSVATKRDIAELKTELKTDIAELKINIAELETRLVRWMIAIGGIVVAAIKFLPTH